MDWLHEDARFLRWRERRLAGYPNRYPVAACRGHGFVSPFTPKLLSPSLWLDASVLSSLQTDGALACASASSQYASVAAAWVTTHPMSFSVWVKPTDRSAVYGLYGITTSTTTTAVVYAELDTNGKVVVSFNGGTNTITSATAVATGSFTNVIVTYDGTTANIYIAGTLDANSGTLANSYGTLANSYIGTIKSNATYL